MIPGVRAHDYGRMTPAALCAAIAADGWRTIQLAFPKAVAGVGSFADVTAALVDETRTALAAHDLTVAVLGAYIEPSLPDDAARRAQVAKLIDALPQAAALNAGCVGTETTNLAKLGGATRADGLRQLRRSLEEILPEAERLGVLVAVEPVHYHVLHSPEATRTLLREMASPQLRVIFDPVNLLRAQDIATQADLWRRCFDCFGDALAAVHIKGASAQVKPDGVLENAPLEDSVVDHAVLFSHLRGRNLPLLRELAVPATAQQDRALLHRLLA